MSLSCHTCGYRSDNAAFFRREAGGVFRRRLTICSGCSPFKVEGQDRSVVKNWASNALICAFIAWNYGSSFSTPLHGAALFLAATFSAPLCVAVHELGHAFVARALGFTVPIVAIGKGPQRAVLRLGATRVEWRRYAFLGGHITYVSHSQPSRLAQALIAMAGPSANLLAALLFAMLPQVFEGEGGFVGAVCTGVMFANLGMALLNLMVWRTLATDDLTETESDGAQILGSFRRRQPIDQEGAMQSRAEYAAIHHRYGEAARLFEQLAAARPCDALFLSKLLHFADRADGPEAALALYQRVVVKGPPSPRPWPLAPMEAYLHANLAWLALKAAGTSHLATAERHAPLAFSAAPEIPVIRATMGVLFIRLGALEKGEALLLEGLRATEDPVDRADFCRFLAQARRVASDDKLASDYEALGRHFLVA